MKREWIRPLFVVAAIYDLLLGAIFLIAYPAVFGRFGVPLPNHSACRARLRHRGRMR